MFGDLESISNTAVIFFYLKIYRARTLLKLRSWVKQAIVMRKLMFSSKKIRIIRKVFLLN